MIFAFCAMCIATFGMAQSISPAVLANSGGSGSTATHQVDWTLGELAIVTLSNGSNVLTQGFHQPNLMTTSTYDGRPELLMNLFPNPTVNKVTVVHESVTPLNARLVNAAGQLVLQEPLPAGGHEILLTQWAEGTYFLSVYDEEQLVKTFTIEKTGN